MIGAVIDSRIESYSASPELLEIIAPVAFGALIVCAVFAVLFALIENHLRNRADDGDDE